MSLKDTFTLKVNGEDRELFMSFGMLNAISRLVGDVQNIGLIQVDPNLMGSIVNEFLAERDDNGNIKKPFNLMHARISSDDINQMMEWVAEHVLDFFMKALESAKRVQDKVEPVVQKLMSSLVGSKD